MHGVTVRRAHLRPALRTRHPALQESKYTVKEWDGGTRRRECEGHRFRDAPSLRCQPGSPSSRHLPRFTGGQRHPLSQRACPPKSGLLLRGLAAKDAGIVRGITEMNLIGSGRNTRPRKNYSAAPSGYWSARRSSFASDSTVVPERFQAPSVSKRRSPIRRPQGAMTRPIARKSLRSTCS